MRVFSLVMSHCYALVIGAHLHAYMHGDPPKLYQWFIALFFFIFFITRYAGKSVLRKSSRRTGFDPEA